MHGKESMGCRLQALLSWGTSDLKRKMWSGGWQTPRTMHSDLGSNCQGQGRASRARDPLRGAVRGYPGPPNQQDPTISMGYHTPAAGVGTGTTFGPRG